MVAQGGLGKEWYLELVWLHGVGSIPDRKRRLGLYQTS